MKYTLLFALIVCSAVSTTAQTFRLLHDFTGGSGAGRCVFGLTLVNGILYGAAGEGGLGEPVAGAIFSIKPDGSEYTLLYSFDGSEIAAPSSTLTLGDDTLYGTAIYGTNYISYGAIFKVGTNGAGFSILHRFDGTNGSSPNSPLILSENTLYGTTASGGPSGVGTIFRLNSDGTAFTTLHSFNGSDDGANPSGLILHSGTLFGETRGGGSSYHGTVFKINTNGTGLAILHDFADASEGTQPKNGFILSGETLYGFTTRGGSSGFGSLFSVTTNGTGFTNLHSFKFATNDVIYPNGLILSGDTLYGTANNNVTTIPHAGGAVFEVKTNGTGFGLVYSFSSTSGVFPFATNSDGANPADLIFSEGVLYGTTIFGGTSGNGTVFSISLPGPSLEISHSQGNIVLKWATNVPGFTLQSATNLLSPVWNPVLPSPTVINGQNTVTNSISDVQRFYRLSQ